MGGKRDDDVHADSAAFVERLQSTFTLACKLLTAAQQRQKAYADKHRIEMSFKVGEQVLLSTKYLNIKHGKTNRKLLPKWIGPFKVVQKVGPVSYKLEMNPGWSVHPVFHIFLLDLYKTDSRIRPPPPPCELEGALEYEVETILKHRTTGQKRHKTSYLIQWKGYGPVHNSWEPEANVANASERLVEYWKGYAEKQIEAGETLGALILKSLVQSQDSWLLWLPATPRDKSDFLVTSCSSKTVSVLILTSEFVSNT
jgi:hypothetical protein